MQAAALRLFVAACCLCATGSHGAAPDPVPEINETDKIAGNLRRTDRARMAKGLGFIEDMNKARERWRDRIGLDYGVSYHAFTGAAMLGDSTPGGTAGELTLQGIWAPGKHRRENPLELHFRARYRHPIGGGTPPSALGEEIGALWGVVDGFSDSGFEVPDFFLRQIFPRWGIEIRYGQMTIDDQFDSYALRGAKQSFLNQAFASDPAVAFPRFGAGVTIEKKWKNGITLALGATNVQGKQSGRQVDLKFDSTALFEAFQIAYDFKSRADRASRVQLLAWHSDAVESAGTPEGQGGSFTFEQELKGPDLRAFARVAWADGGATSVQSLFSAGLAWKIREKNLLGLAAGIGRGSGSGHPVQAVIEGFCRIQLREGFRISPDFQILMGEGFHEKPGMRIVAGLRAGFDF